MAHECKTSGKMNYNTAAKIANENILMAGIFLSFILEYTNIRKIPRPSLRQYNDFLIFVCYSSKLTHVTVSGSCTASPEVLS